MGRWTPALLTGNEVVDREHKELVALIDRLELIGNGPDGNGAADALDELTDYVYVHFQMEEKLMAREQYPARAMEAHIAEHQALRLKTQELVREYNDGKISSVDPIIEFLYEWFAHHIAEVDTAMAQHVRANHAGA